MKQEDIDRFHTRYTVEINGCWIWHGKKGKSGYGKFRVYESGRKKDYIASRFSLEFLGKGLSVGKLALHTCDHRLCVNPEHLYEGTVEDNARDTQIRTPRGVGEKSSHHSLTETQVISIFSEVGTYREIGKKYGTTAMNVSLIKAGKTWAHLGLGKNNVTYLQRLEDEAAYKKAKAQLAYLEKRLGMEDSLTQ